MLERDNFQLPSQLRLFHDLSYRLERKRYSLARKVMSSWGRGLPPAPKNHPCTFTQNLYDVSTFIKALKCDINDDC